MAVLWPKIYFASFVVPGVIGNLQALEVLKLVTGIGGTFLLTLELLSAGFAKPQLSCSDVFRQTINV